MQRSFRFLAVLACALPLACADSSTTPTVTAPASVPIFSANPASNGAVVARYSAEGDYWTGWYDPSRDQIAVVTTFNFAAVCAGENPAATSIDWKVVTSGNVESLYHVVGKVPEAFIYVYEGYWTTWSWCKPPIMSGTGTAMTTDSDYAGGGNGVDAWGIMASGQVTDEEGQAYGFNGHFRVVFSPNGNHEQGFINLQPMQ